MAQTKQKCKVKSKVISHGSVESPDEDSEHELFYYAGNRIKLMKEVLKLIKPKKIKSIAPDFMKNLDIEEINSMLLEELLGISNKRLKHILNGENIDETSSSESEDETPIDIISLDDISDSDDDFGLVGVETKAADVLKKDRKERHKNKRVPKPIKEEKPEKTKKKSNGASDKTTNNESENEKLMSVLEILELQARARAIRSQLALENVNKKQNEQVASINVKDESSDESDAIVVASPKNEEIVITSSESENEGTKSIEQTQPTENPKSTKDVETPGPSGKSSHNHSEDVTLASSELKQNASGQTGDAPEVIDEAVEVIDVEIIDEPGDLVAEQSKSDTVTAENKNVVANEESGCKTGSKNNTQTAAQDKSDSENDDVINLDIEEMDND